jgi:preprotein translocase, yajC subunit
VNTLNTFFLAANSSNSMLVTIFMVVIMFGFMYFAMIRPQKKQQQVRMKMLSELKKGDKVILLDGMHCKIDTINGDDTIVVDADGIFLTFSRSAIRQILPDDVEANKPVTTNENVETKDEEK